MNNVINPIPMSVMIVAITIIGVEAYLFFAEIEILASIGERLAWVSNYSVRADVFQWQYTTSRIDILSLSRFVTFSFVHVSTVEALIALVIMLAMGKFTAEVLGNFAFLVLFFGSGIFGAIVFCFLPENYPLAGAMTGTYGLIAAYSYIIFSRSEGVLAHQLRAFQLIGVLLILQVVLAVLTGGPLIWVAKIASAAAGFGLVYVLSPGKLQAFFSQIRRD